MDIGFTWPQIANFTQFDFERAANLFKEHPNAEHYTKLQCAALAHQQVRLCHMDKRRAVLEGIGAVTMGELSDWLVETITGKKMKDLL